MKKTALLFMLVLFIGSCQAEDPSSIRYDMQGYIEDVRIDSEGAFINILVNGILTMLPIWQICLV